MPVSSAMDGNLGVMRALDRNELPTDSFTCGGTGFVTPFETFDG